MEWQNSCIGHMESYQEGGPGAPSEEAMRESVMRVQELYM